MASHRNLLRLLIGTLIDLSRTPCNGLQTSVTSLHVELATSLESQLQCRTVEMCYKEQYIWISLVRSMDTNIQWKV